MPGLSQSFSPSLSILVLNHMIDRVGENNFDSLAEDIKSSVWNVENMLTDFLLC